MATTTNALDVVMKREYEEAARKAFLDPATLFDYAPTVGFETEYSVVKASDTKLIDQEVRDSIVSQDPDLMGPELGPWQLEVKGQPVNLAMGGFSALEEHVKECENRAVRAASQHHAQLVRIGSYPLHPIEHIQRSRARRYELVVGWHNEHHSAAVPTFIGAVRTTGSTTAEIVALMNSVQFNWAMPSAKEAVKLLNISFAVLAQIVAVSGNSRYVGNVDTQYADTRMLLWEKTHDTRTPIEIITNAQQRVGLPNSYFKDIGEYISFVASQPFILNKPGDAFEVGTGLNWSDARLKVRNNKILLEFRPVSVQPSVEEDVALCAFYIGLLQYYRAEDQSLPPFALVRSNRYEAMRHGLEAVFMEMNGEGTVRRVPASEVVAEGLKKAKIGLISAGFRDGVDRLEILQERLLNMRTPSDEFAHHVEQLQADGVPFEAALENAVRECVVIERQ